MTEVEIWIKKINKAENNYKDFYDKIRDIRRYYKNEKSKNKQNIFWATIETLKPFLYFKEPKVYIEQKEKSGQVALSVACRILEKALANNMEKIDFDSVMKYVRNDFLLFGFGAAFERYVPTFQECTVWENGQNVSLKILKDEKIETVYINPEDFLADSEKVGVWEDCTWVARKIVMSNEEIATQFGQNMLQKMHEKGEISETTLVYEIWDKTTKKVLYLAPGFPFEFLKIKEDVLGLEDFFVMPKPLFGTLANDGIIPTPDFDQLKPLLDELSGVTGRMQLLMQAVKVTGAYDSSFPELANILNKDVTLVALSDFERLKESGGIKGVVDFAPIEQYISALSVLASRREDIMKQIYDMTGVSDIMRGSSDKTETATAVEKKTNFGTLRNQDRQNDMIRFITDLFKMKAEMICSSFSIEHLKMFADPQTDEKDVQTAVFILKEQKLRGIILGVETDTAFMQNHVSEQTQRSIQAVHALIKEAFELVSLQPALLPLYRQMISTLVSTMPSSRQYEPVIEKVFEKIDETLHQTPLPSKDILTRQLEQQQQKMWLDYDIKNKEVALKKEEVDIKKSEALRKASQDAEVFQKKMTKKQF